MDEKLKQVTYRIPGGLSDAIERAAEARHISVSQLVREALEEAVNPKGRKFEYPGLTTQFQEFLEERAPKGKAPKHMILLVEDFRGQRVFYDGILHDKAGSLIVLATTPNLVPIPCHYIQAWYPLDDLGKLPTMALMFAQEGWRPTRRYF